MTALGMITPSSNTCLEPVTYRLLAGSGVTAHFARVPVTRIALDAEAVTGFGPQVMLEAARLLAAAGVDVIAWNGTAGSWLGLEHDRRLVELVESETGIPATTSTLAILAACRAYGVTRLGLAVPYTREVTERIVAEYARHGLRCVGVAEAGLSDNRAFAAIPPAAVAEQIRQVAVPQAHAVAVVCTNVHGAELVADLEPDLGLPIFDSVAATLWHSLELAGGRPLRGHGSLLATGGLRIQLEAVTATLREATGSDRVTLRMQLPRLGIDVDRPVAESAAPGVRPLRHDSSLDQRRLATVRWLDAHRRPLVQPEFGPAPLPPRALVDGYGVRAQMLGPIVREGRLGGWLSVHSRRPRTWGPVELAALSGATRDVHKLLDQL